MFFIVFCSVVQPPAEKPCGERRVTVSPPNPLYSELCTLQTGKELQDYLWPRPPHYSLLWPGRPLPALPPTKDPLPPTPDLSEMFARSQQEPFFGFFFSNNNFALPSSKEGKSKRENGISRFMDGPFFRWENNNNNLTINFHPVTQARIQRVCFPAF